MIITPQDAATILDVTDSRVRQLIREGALKPKGKFGRTIILSKNSVLRLKARREAAKAIKRASQVPAANRTSQVRAVPRQRSAGQAWFDAMVKAGRL